jgi:hypothetical protein
MAVLFGDIFLKEIQRLLRQILLLFNYQPFNVNVMTVKSVERYD